MDNDFVFGNLGFKIGDPVGQWGTSFTNTVYEASVRVTLSKLLSYPYGDNSLIVKLAPHTDGETKAVLEQELMAQNTFKTIPKNILLHHHSFKIVRNGVKTLVAVLPYKDLVSIRQAMCSQSPLPLGIPEDCIAIALRGTVKALMQIHLREKVHKFVTAGTIFYHKKDKLVKLAYGAALYERNDLIADEYSPKSSLITLSQWGRAPEIHNLSDDDGYSSASDVWLLGLAALEMAYGTIQVSGREELLYIANYVSQNRVLPPVWSDLRDAFNNRNKTVFSLGFLGRCLNALSRLAFGQTEDPQPTFSREFVNLISYCLEKDPQRRPSSLVLLKHPFFREAVSTMKFFEKRLDI